jgi:hypothetical protein
VTNGLEAVLRQTADSLDALGAHWCLVGGLAIAVRAEPRFTRDVDVAVSVSDDEAAEHLVRELHGREYVTTASLEHDVTGRLASVRLQPPGEQPGGIVLDVLFASSGIEPEVVAASDALEIIPGLPMRIARVGHLIALKLLSADDERPQDAIDVRALRDVAAHEDVELARSAARLIHERGYARGPDVERSVTDVFGET